MECCNDFTDVFEARKKYQICLGEHFEILNYIPVTSILQKGPQCGLVVLQMYLASQKMEISISEIFSQAKSMGYTLNGEMFSTKNLARLTEKFVYSDKVQVITGSLMGEAAIEHLKTGFLFVPYDADGNHAPCLKRGHKAHWCLVTGLIVSNDRYLICARHGKSKFLAIWSLEELAQSNAQLEEVSPARTTTETPYSVPAGGLSGPNGIKNQFILLS